MIGINKSTINHQITKIADFLRIKTNFTWLKPRHLFKENNQHYQSDEIYSLNERMKNEEKKKSLFIFLFTWIQRDSMKSINISTKCGHGLDAFPTFEIPEYHLEKRKKWFENWRFLPWFIEMSCDYFFSFPFNDDLRNHTAKEKAAIYWKGKVKYKPWSQGIND